MPIIVMADVAVAVDVDVVIVVVSVIVIVIVAVVVAVDVVDFVLDVDVVDVVVDVFHVIVVGVVIVIVIFIQSHSIRLYLLSPIPCFQDSSRCSHLSGGLFESVLHFNDSIWGQRATMAFRVHSLHNFRRPCSLLAAYSPCASHSGVGKRDARAILFSAVSPGDAIYSRASSLRNILSQVILCAEEGCESWEIGERACGQTILHLSLLSCR